MWFVIIKKKWNEMDNFKMQQKWYSNATHHLRISYGKLKHADKSCSNKLVANKAKFKKI